MHPRWAGRTVLAIGCALVAGSAEVGAQEPAVKAIRLPQPSAEGTASVEEVLRARRSVREFRAEGMTLADLSQLLWAAQGVTGAGGRRTAPSAGALYPLEVYLVAGNVTGLPAGVYRFRPAQHDLVLVEPGDHRAEVSDAALGQGWAADAAVIVALAAVYERTTVKYRERGVRYVHMEVGLAAENVYLQATAMGLGTTFIGAFRDDAVKEVLGLSEEEVPLALLPVGRPR